MRSSYLPLVVLTSFFGFVVGAALSSPLTEMWANGALTRWQPLGLPPGKAIDILDFSYNTPQGTYDVYVATETGDVYVCCRQSQPQWKWTSQPQAPFVVECGTLNLLPGTLPTGSIVDCAEPPGPMESLSYQRTIFIVLDNGTVWRWHNFVPLAGLMPVILTCLSMLMGAMGGAVVIWQIGRRQSKGTTSGMAGDRSE
jgi:hypothetical protein